jgi:hypothetical protein
LKKRNYQTNQEQLKADDTRKVLSLVMLLITTVGALFVMLSFVIFIINFQLLIAKAKNEIDIILNLGYSYNAISNVLNLQLLSILSICFIAIIAALIYTFKKLAIFTTQKGFDISGKLNTEVILGGVGIVILLMILNNITLRFSLKK